MEHRYGGANNFPVGASHWIQYTDIKEVKTEILLTAKSMYGILWQKTQNKEIFPDQLFILGQPCLSAFLTQSFTFLSSLLSTTQGHPLADLTLNCFLLFLGLEVTFSASKYLSPCTFKFFQYLSRFYSHLFPIH